VALAPVSASSELPLVHAVNLLIFAATLASFGFFLAELIRHREASLHAEAARPLLSSRALCCIALVAFAWGAGRLIGVGRVTPDLLVAALWFAALALLLRSFRLPDSRRVLVALGVVLGLGYLAKTAMLPIALSFVVVSAFAGNLRRGLHRGLIVAGALAAVSAPFAVAISVRSDRATIGTSSELGYAWLVHGAPHFVNLPNEHTSPLLRRAPRPLLQRPPTFAFGAPVGGTFPLWYDPTYWYDGTGATFDLGAQLRAVRHSGRVYLDMLRVAPGVELLAGLGLLTLLTARARLPTRRLLAYLRFLVPAFAGLALYAAVHVEPRFVGAFLTTVFVGLFSALSLPSGRRRGWAAFAVVAAVIVTGLWFSARTPVLSAAGDNGAVEAAQRDAANQVEAARALGRAGLARCTLIALVDDPTALVKTNFPLLAKARIVAAVTDAPAGWSVSRRLTGAISRSGAEILIARRVPAARSRAWRRLGSSDYFAYAPYGRSGASRTAAECSARLERQA
jgi:hypothetical protein